MTHSSDSNRARRTPGPPIGEGEIPAEPFSAALASSALQPDDGPSAPARSVRTPREMALRALLPCFDGQGRAREHLDAMQARASFSADDFALAVELTTGTLRRRITLEHIASRFYRGRWEGLPLSVRLILALGVYQLCWLDRIPAHAAVHEAVALARKRGKGAAATVNAVLRAVEKCRGVVTDQPGSPDPRRWLPIDAARGRVFDADVFPDPARRPLEHLVTVTGHPMYLVERWHRRFKPRLCRQICEAGMTRSPLVLRANRLRATPQALFDELTAAGLSCRLDGETGAVTVTAGVALADLPQFEAGSCQPQDLASQRVLARNPPAPDEFVLDLCAGVGTKATQAAELLGDRGLVLAHDVDARKLDRLREGAARLGITILLAVGPGELEKALADVGRAPDLILVDAPCSNTGVLARRLEARYRATHRQLVEVTQLQRNILEQALRLAGPRTRILYATCSIEREENEEQARWACETFDSWRISGEELALPDRGHGGGYWALLQRGDGP